MTEIIYVCILLTEVLMILQCMQITFRQKACFDKDMLGMILVNIIVFMAINLQVIPLVFSVLVYIALFIYCRRTFKQSMKITMVRYIIAMALVSCIQSMVCLIVGLATGMITDILRTLISSVLGLVIAYAIKKIMYLMGKRKLTIRNRGIFALVITCGLVLGTTMMNFYVNTGMVDTNVVLVSILVMLMFFCLYWLEQANGEIERKNYELEMQRVYGSTYEQLLREVRRKQHDYKNQIGAIYSMHLVANSLEELVDMQSEYMEELQSDSKYDAILTRCGNAILAGYLYYRCMSCEQEGVTVDYDIRIDKADCSFAVHEIIELLGVFIDNACENFTIEQQSDKHIKLKLKEEDEKIIFSVENPAKHMSFSEMSNMFVRGYSSKGENRGIGLARVRELVDSYNAELKVENVSYEEENWLRFSIEAAKNI